MTTFTSGNESLGALNGEVSLNGVSEASDNIL